MKKLPEIASRTRRSTLWDIPMACGCTNYVHGPAGGADPPKHQVCYLCFPPPNRLIQLEISPAVLFSGRGKRLTR